VRSGAPESGGAAGTPWLEQVSADPGVPALGHSMGVPPAGPAPAARELAACERAAVAAASAGAVSGLTEARFVGTPGASALGTATNESSSTAATATASQTQTVVDVGTVNLVVQ
jgi:hypothetical protein